MPFPEIVKLSVRRRAHFTCCLCKSLGVEIHHVVPQEQGGGDTDDNAAPLCPSCHETYGANPQKRKFIIEARDLWYEICEVRYGSDCARLDEIERMLSNIEDHVRAASFPILPIHMFYTLRHTTTEETIAATFSSLPGFKSMQEKLLQLTGAVRLGGIGAYNPIQIPVQHSHCKLTSDKLGEVVSKLGHLGEKVLKYPVAIDLRFSKRSTGSVADSTLHLHRGLSDWTPDDVKAVELFDDQIFQDILAAHWKVQNPSKSVWSTAGLYGSTLTLRIMYMSFDDINLEHPPKLHNLHLYFGLQTPHILFFTEEQLSSPKVHENPEPIARWNFSSIGMPVREMLIEYTFELTDDLLSSQLRQLA